MLHNREDAEYLVKAFPVSIRYRRGMPSISTAISRCRSSARRRWNWSPPPSLSAPVRWHRRNPARAVPRQPHIRRLLPRDIPGSGAPANRAATSCCSTRASIEDSRDWSGSFVGTSFIFTDRAELRTLEGDPRFFFDDAQTPQAQGTGTEEWGGGGDYWGGPDHDAALGRPPHRRREAGGCQNAGRSGPLGLPVPAGGPVPLRPERPHPAGARRHQRHRSSTTGP